MRAFVVAILIGLVFCANKCERLPQYAVTLQLTKTESYCGGAAPPEFLLKELRTPKPYDGNTLYVFDVEDKCIDSISKSATDSIFKFPMVAGTYKLRYVNVLSDEKYTTDREDCLSQWKQRVMAEFEVRSDTSLTVNVHFDCNPCYPPPP